MQKSISLRGRVETDEDIEIGQWHKSVGAEFGADDVLVEVISNKAVFEVSAGEPGRLVSILHSDGEVVSLDDAVAVIETSG